MSSIGQFIVNSSGQYYWKLVADISKLSVVEKLVDIIRWLAVVIFLLLILVGTLLPGKYFLGKRLRSSF